MSSIAKHSSRVPRVLNLSEYTDQRLQEVNAFFYKSSIPLTAESCVLDGSFDRRCRQVHKEPNSFNSQPKVPLSVFAES